MTFYILLKSLKNGYYLVNKGRLGGGKFADKKLLRQFRALRDDIT